MGKKIEVPKPPYFPKPLAKSARLVYNQLRNRRILVCPTVAQSETNNQFKNQTDYRLSPIGVEDSLSVYLRLCLLSMYVKAANTTSKSVSTSKVFIPTHIHSAASREISANSSSVMFWSLPNACSPSSSMSLSFMCGITCLICPIISVLCLKHTHEIDFFYCEFTHLLTSPSVIFSRFPFPVKYAPSYLSAL